MLGFNPKVVTNPNPNPIQTQMIDEQLFSKKAYTLHVDTVYLEQALEIQDTRMAIMAIVADVKSKYLVNEFQCFGEDEAHPAGVRLAYHVYTIVTCLIMEL